MIYDRSDFDRVAQDYRRWGGSRPAFMWKDEPIDWVFTDPDAAARDMSSMRDDIKQMLVELTS